MKELVWKKFSEEKPKCKYVWVSDGIEIWLRTYEGLIFGPGENTVWAEVEMPPLPKKQRHHCRVIKFDEEGLCNETDEGLELTLWALSDKVTMMVKFCPFCGFEPKV